LLFSGAILIDSELVLAQITTTNYAGTMTVTSIVAEGEDQTPPAGKNTLPVRFSLNKNED